MIIKVDIREQELLNNINRLVSTIPIFKNNVIKTETLPLGDIIIGDEKEDKIIIERKSVSDLLSSIKDGRYEEQSYRLNGLDHHNHNIVYLIEGDVNRINRFKGDNGVDKLMLYSAMFSLNYYKGFSVFRSISIEESATIVCNMAYKLEKEALTKQPFYKNKLVAQTTVQEQSGGSSEETEKDYVNVVKKVKKENITPENIGEIMLCQIPGISSVTALAILNKYNTLPELISAIQQDNNCLNDVTYTNSKEQTRKINKTSIANIVKFLLKK